MFPCKSPTGKTTVETADAAGDWNGAKVQLAPWPPHCHSEQVAIYCLQREFPKLLIYEPLCSKVHELNQQQKNQF